MPAAVSANPVQATAGTAGVGIGLADAPGQAYIVESVEPGQTITRRVRVSNDGAARDISIYAGPARVVDNIYSVENEGETNALSSWTSVDKPTVRLGDGQESQVTVTIKVPADAPAGAVHGSIWASLDGSRTGVRMYVTVGGDNGPAADFTVTDLTPQRRADGTAVVAATVANIGDRAIDLAGTLRLTINKQVVVVRAQPASLAARASGAVLFVVPDSAALDKGPWVATARMNNGYYIHDIAKTITFPDASPDIPSPPSSGSLGSLGSLSTSS